MAAPSVLCRLTRGAARGLRLARRDPSRALLALRMAGFLAFFCVAARTMPLPRALRMAGFRRPRRPAAVRRGVVQVGGVVDALLALDVWFVRPICWKRAVLLHRYLGAEGIDARIVLGVRNDPEFGAHAWVEAGGRPLLERTEPRYRPIYSFPEASAPLPPASDVWRSRP
jgi:hypothetical protein